MSDFLRILKILFKEAKSVCFLEDIYIVYQKSVDKKPKEKIRIKKYVKKNLDKLALDLQNSKKGSTQNRPMA